ncbi:leucine-rich repeat-containing protein 45 [Neolamprologus brichardi]|uniref:leucine-rich repeat-containing protein 45 n=1 Tax=Neolamprologus brichardi TaxID=32507 RepID=UPI0016439B53|nr:leucine-rich repeat-containing protein 45 [Neolamprologus brichardi]
MEDFRRIYLRLCKEGGVEPQEGVVAQLQESRSAQGSRLDLSGQSLSADTCSVLAKAFHKDTVFTEVSFSDCMLSEEGARVLLSGLFDNTTVKVLDLKGNNLRSSGAETQIKLLFQFLSLMETIDRQRDEMGRSSRSTSVQIGQLQEALNERKSAVNSLTAKLQMTEAALALSEQKNQNMGELLSRLKAEKEEQREQHSKDRKKEHEDAALRQGKLLRDIQNLTDTNGQLKTNVEEVERRCKSQQQLIFELKQELTTSTAELKLRLAQAEDRLESEKRRSKQALDDMDSLRQKEVEHINRHLEESERALQDRIFKLEGQRIQLEEVRGHTTQTATQHTSIYMFTTIKVIRASVTSSKSTVHSISFCVDSSEQQEHVSSLEEKLRSVRSSLQEVQLHCSQQKQTISELQAKNSQQSIEMDGLRRRIEELQQELCCKDQEKVAEVSRVRVELQEQIGRLQAERTAQGALKEKINALERELKVLSSNHREALLDKESEMSSMLEKLRLKEAEIHRIREDEANRASYLQSAVLSYIHGSPLGHHSSLQK